MKTMKMMEDKRRLLTITIDTNRSSLVRAIDQMLHPKVMLAAM
jgi:hypothetical protein